MSYDTLLAKTLRAYVRPMLEYTGVDVSGLTDDEVQKYAEAYARAPYTCGECGTKIEGMDT